MNFSTLMFPLAVDFSGDEYWIEGEGPFKCGEAVTAFLVDSDLDLTKELEVYLRAFGNVLSPYAVNEKVTEEQFRELAGRTAVCSVGYGFHAIPHAVALVERYTFSSLCDFLYVELGKAILHGNSPRQCRLCGKWFFHEKGDRAIYCERIAPGETERTCREAGARTVFEKKIQDEDAWKIYKRAYKKYYARFMKGTMSQEEFKAWTEQASADRDAALRQLKRVSDAMLTAQIIEQLREQLNRK